MTAATSVKTGKPNAGHLNRSQRDAARDMLRAQTLDVLVIGGGVVGAGAAMPAGSRGLAPEIIEAHNWVSGTAAPVAAEIMAGFLGWDADHTTDKVSRYRAFVDREGSAMTLPDGASAGVAMTAEVAQLRWQGNRP